MVENKDSLPVQIDSSHNSNWTAYLGITLVCGLMGLFSFFLAIFSISEFVMALSIGTSLVIFFASLVLVSYGKVVTAFAISTCNVLFFFAFAFTLELSMPLLKDVAGWASKIENPIGSNAALKRAVREGLLRHATPEDLKTWREAYLTNKYTNKGLVISPTDDAMIGSVNLAETYWVRSKFTLPWGKGGTNRAVFFVPKGVPFPDGELGQSAVYDFESLLVSCSGARTGTASC